MRPQPPLLTGASSSLRPPKPLTGGINDDALVAAWHSSDSLRALSEQLNVAQHWLEREWRRLKYQDKLPNTKRISGGGRPKQMSVYERIEASDLPPLWSDDPLLDRLRAVHGEQGREDLYPGTRVKL